MRKKLKIAQYSLTCCEGCTVNLINTIVELLPILDKVEIVSSRMLGYVEPVEADIALVDGSIITKHDEEIAKVIREKSKIVVAFGACAHLGGLNALKELFSHDEVIKVTYGKFPEIPHIKEVKALSEVIKVDYVIPGCPPDTEEIGKFLTDMALGKIFRLTDKPVCYECKAKGIPCLLEKGIICLGPITRGGCDAKCPSYKVSCIGCRGPAEDFSLEAYLESLEKNNIPTQELKNKLPIFMTKTKLKKEILG